MVVVNSGFGSRRGARNSRLPPGQTLVDDWPVLTAGLTPDIGTHEWTFSITTETGTAHGWDWNALQDVGVEDIVTDIHCSPARTASWPRPSAYGVNTTILNDAPAQSVTRGWIATTPTVPTNCSTSCANQPRSHTGASENRLAQDEAMDLVAQPSNPW